MKIIAAIATMLALVNAAVTPGTPLGCICDEGSVLCSFGDGSSCATSLGDGGCDEAASSCKDIFGKEEACSTCEVRCESGSPPCDGKCCELGSKCGFDGKCYSGCADQVKYGCSDKELLVTCEQLPTPPEFLNNESECRSASTVTKCSSSETQQDSSSPSSECLACGGYIELKCAEQNSTSSSTTTGGSGGSHVHGLVVLGVLAFIFAGVAVSFFLYRRGKRSSATLLDDFGNDLDIEDAAENYLPPTSYDVAN